MSRSCNNIALEYTIKDVQENQVGLKLNGTHHLLVYTNVIFFLGGGVNINTVQKYAEALIILVYI
jgi:hypothetical protein